MTLDEKSPATSEIPSSTIAVGDYKPQVYSQPDIGQSNSRPVCGVSATSEGENSQPSKDKAVLYLYQMLCEASSEFRKNNVKLLNKLRETRNRIAHPSGKELYECTDDDFDEILYTLSKDGDKSILTPDEVEQLRHQFWEEFKIKVRNKRTRKHRS